MLSSHEKQYHINVAAGDVGKYCILPGDPGRCEKIAAYFEDTSELTEEELGLYMLGVKKQIYYTNTITLYSFFYLDTFVIREYICCCHKFAVFL